MFPDNLHIIDPTDGVLYIVENDVVTSSMSINKEARGILVAQDMANIYTVNSEQNTITRINNGVSLGDIVVGRQPYGICEDPEGYIYVTNYLDNTVTVIRNGQVYGYPIPVDKGPRGIVSDFNGNIYVACYLSNTVCRLVNKTLVDKIDVPFNPEGITCSPRNEIWVTCSGSNVVVKILRGEKKLTVNTGKCPVSVVCDKIGNVFTANFEDDSVTMFSSVNGTTQDITVGDGPTSVGINSSGLIYVTSNLSGEKVYKINPKSALVIDRIQVCKSQCAFGDFTGCATYNAFYPTGNSGSSSSISNQAVQNVVQALKPTIKPATVTENAAGLSVTFDSDLMDLTKFNHVKLNTKEPNSDGSFTFSQSELAELGDAKLVGFYNADDTDSVTFASINFKNIFTVIIGCVDMSYKNFTVLARKVIDFNNKDSVAVVVQQPIKGELVIAIPNRVVNTVKNGMIVQGSQNISEHWADDEVLVEDADDPNASITYASVVNQLPEADRTYFKVYVNNYSTNAASKWIFNFYKL